MQNDTTLKLLRSQSSDNFILGVMGCQGLEYIEKDLLPGGIERMMFKSHKDGTHYNCDKIVVIDYGERALAWFSEHTGHLHLHPITHDQAVMIIDHLKEQVSKC